MAHYRIASDAGVTVFETYKHPLRAVCRMAKAMANKFDEEMTIINTRTNSLVRIVRPAAWGMRDI